MADSLEDLFRRSGLRRLVDQLAKQLRSYGSLRHSTRLSTITDEERTALLSLTGIEFGIHACVDLESLRRVLRNARDGRELEDIIEAIDGTPLREHAAQRRDRKAAWEQVFLNARSQVEGSPRLLDWLEGLRKSGQLTAIHAPEEAAELLQTILSIALELPLPVTASVRLAQFAAQEFGDAHALDQDRLAGRLLVSAAAAVVGLESPPGNAARRRQVWKAAGIVPDELSSTVLAWNLRADGDSLVADVLNIHAHHGEPVRLTLGQLTRHPVKFFRRIGDGVISICENPAVMEVAAAELRTAGRPLICTEGQPGVAAMQLLTALSQEGLPLRYHGDFDWGGIQIANRLWTAFPQMIPWRFAADDYIAHQSARRLDGQFVEASWDSELAAVMKTRGLAVDEEVVVDDLLDDLRL